MPFGSLVHCHLTARFTGLTGPRRCSTGIERMHALGPPAPGRSHPWSCGRLWPTRGASSAATTPCNALTERPPASTSFAIAIVAKHSRQRRWPDDCSRRQRSRAPRLRSDQSSSARASGAAGSCCPFGAARASSATPHNGDPFCSAEGADHQRQMRGSKQGAWSRRRDVLTTLKADCVGRRELARVWLIHA